MSVVVKKVKTAEDKVAVLRIKHLPEADGFVTWDEQKMAKFIKSIFDRGNVKQLIIDVDSGVTIHEYELEDIESLNQEK